MPYWEVGRGSLQKVSDLDLHRAEGGGTELGGGVKGSCKEGQTLEKYKVVPKVVKL